VEVGLGLRNPEDMTAILESQDRANAGRLVPPEGLMLMKVEYE
jgi:tRNA pseudouridine38-40 synthase